MPPELTALATPILHWSVGTLLAFSVLAFVGQFLLPGIRIGRQLKKANQKLMALKAAGLCLILTVFAAK
jgi:hypothetical protein